MKRIILFISLLGIAAVACNTLDEPNLTEVHELTVGLPTIDSKALYWKNGDVISLVQSAKIGYPSILIRILASGTLKSTYGLFKSL